MSCEFLIYARLKKTRKPKTVEAVDFSSKKYHDIHEKDINLWYLCTTPSRQLDKDMHFVFDKETKIDDTYISEIITVEDENIATVTKEKERLTAKLKYLNSSLARSKTSDIYDKINQDINDTEDSIESYQEDLDSYLDAKQTLLFIQRIMTDYHNVKYYNYYYYFG